MSRAESRRVTIRRPASRLPLLTDSIGTVCKPRAPCPRAYGLRPQLAVSIAKVARGGDVREEAPAARVGAWPANSAGRERRPCSPHRAGRGPGRPRGAKSSAERTAIAKASRPAKAARKGRVGRPKGSGKRAAEALALVTEKPGITIPEWLLDWGSSPSTSTRCSPRWWRQARWSREAVAGLQRTLHRLRSRQDRAASRA
jgi:hypothetical protein